MARLCQDSLVIMLICSDLGLTLEMKARYKPYTLSQWNKLGEKIINSSLKKPSSLLAMEKDVIKRELFLDDFELNRIEFLLKRGGHMAIEIERLEGQGIYITTRAEPDYPVRLKKVLKKYSPPFFYYSGNINIANKKSVAIVGSRDVDEEGIFFTQKLSSKCVREGYAIVSGGAKGVDSIAENEAIKKGGITISIVSDNLSRKIKEKNIRNTILDGKMLVVSVANPSAKFSVYAAMDRNKYIYALSQFAIAISATENKGGTWTGAIENIKKSWVPLFVRNGANIPSGNKKLIDIGGVSLEQEVIEDNNIQIKQWFESNISKKIEQPQHKQIDIYNFGQNEEKVLENKKDTNFKDEDNRICNQNKCLDVYSVILPIIKEALSEPKNQGELSELINVNKSQVSQWIKRAIKDGIIVKLKNPIRYGLKK